MLEKLFPSSEARVVEWLILHERWAQNQKDLCEALKIYPKAMRKILARLEGLKIIRVTKRIAKSKFYRINPECALVNPLRVLIQDLNFFLAEQEAQSQLGG